MASARRYLDIRVVAVVGSSSAIAWCALGAFGGTDLPTPLLGALALAGFAVAVLRRERLRNLGAGGRFGVASLYAFAAWSTLATTWSDDRGAASHAALSTVALVAAATAIATLVPAVAAPSAAVGLACGSASVGLTSLVVAVADPGSLVAGRLAWPTGYPNGAAAVFGVGAWLALATAVRPEPTVFARRSCVTLSVLLGGLVLCTQSRGAVFVAPIVAVVLVVLPPRRLAAATTLVVAGGLVASTAPFTAQLSSAATGHERSALAAALLAVGAATIAAAVLSIALIPAIDGVTGRRGRGALAAAGLVVVTVSAALAAPRAGDAWRELTTPPRESSPRSLGNLEGNRWDLWRVGLLETRDRLLAGAGPGGFEHAYAARGRTDERPVNAHSLVIETLYGTGVIGLILLVCFLGGWAWAAWPLTETSGAILSTGLVALVAHACVDWLWELPSTALLFAALLGTGLGLDRCERSVRTGFGVEGAGRRRSEGVLTQT